MNRLLFLLTIVTLGWVPVPLSAQDLVVSRARLESPSEGSFASGVGLIRGWVCDATTVEVEMDGGERWLTAYGTRREDTMAVCGDSDNGFGLTFNWNRLGEGSHTLRAFADGVAFAKVSFTVTTLGQEYLHGVDGESTLSDFPLPLESVTVKWSETQQNFMFVAVNGVRICQGSVVVNPAGAYPQAGLPLARLENPSPGSCESGIGLIRGWVCDAARVEVQIDDGEPWLTAYGTRREDTVAVCGDQDNGFGLTLNWNRFDSGEHVLRAFADGMEFASVIFTVTSLGQEYLRGAGGTYVAADFPVTGQNILLSWQESEQNFVISDSSLQRPPGQDALALYVAKPDSSYAFRQYHSERGNGWDTYFLRMISQRWRSAKEVNRVLWEHELMITVPWALHAEHSHTAVLFIDGGDNGEPPLMVSKQAYDALAVSLGSVVAVVRQIPNQPLHFTDEPGRWRREDAILAYSMDKFLLTGDPEWPVHVAMTKAAVRAMDTVQTFLANRHPIDDFLMVGGSKRGWTVWLAAAVDRRIKAILPVSFDLLNMDRQFIHQWEAYGFFAPALQDYADFDLPCRLQTPRGRALLRLIDPYQRRLAYTMPKLLLEATGDQFFMSDSILLYYAALPGPKWLRFRPNVDHGQGVDMLLAGIVWMNEIADRKDCPRYGWIQQVDRTVLIKAATEPNHIRLWQANNPTARDFRMEALGPAWSGSEIQAGSDGFYRVNVAPPEQGWTAFMVELDYNGSEFIEPDYVFTTSVFVTPDTLPYLGSACPGQGGG